MKKDKDQMDINPLKNFMESVVINIEDLRNDILNVCIKTAKQQKINDVVKEYRQNKNLSNIKALPIKANVSNKKRSLPALRVAEKSKKGKGKGNRIT